MSGLDPLTRYLIDAARGEPAEPGFCHDFVAGWYERTSGRSLPWPLPHGPEAEAEGIYRGMVRICRDLGLQPVEKPVRGDIGLFTVSGVMMGGIHTGNCWTAMTDVGVAVYRQAETVKAWAVTT